MSGHSKWANIKHRKGAQDAKRGKIFTKCAREIIMAAKQGGEDLEMNPRLRVAVQKAKGLNMPNDNIKRAIQRAVGGSEGKDLEEVVYEAYAQEGVALIIEIVTDNKNRTLPEIKSIVSKAGGNMAEKGSVSYMFSKKGILVFDGNIYNEEQIMEIALEFDVEDIISHDDQTIEVIVDPASFVDLKNMFDEKQIETLNAEVANVAATNIPIENIVVARKIVNMLNNLDDQDDVQNVYSNYEPTDSVYAELSEEGLV